MTTEQVEAYALHVRIQEITQKLRIDDVVPTSQCRRSLSPAPTYDTSGRRTNTRHQRHRARLEDELDSLVQAATRTIPDYRPPQSYMHRHRGRQQRLVEAKVYIPTKDFPEVNFIGQLLGPRGRSLDDINNQSGAKIYIHGRGSVKEGRGRCGDRRGHIDRSREESLHCLVTATTQDKVDKAKALIQAVIETATSTPEVANERKVQQLRDLAVVNGTFRDYEGVGGLRDEPRQEWMATEHMSPPGRTWGWGSC